VLRNLAMEEAVELARWTRDGKLEQFSSRVAASVGKRRSS
jgi:hypothetical protein